MKMKKLFIRNKIIVLLLALTLVLFSVACSQTNETENSNVNVYETNGIYTSLASDVTVESELQLKELKAKVSNDGKYLLLVTAFDDSFLKADGLYYIGYKYTFNGVEVDTTKLEGAKTATYYGAVKLNSVSGVTELGAEDIYVNEDYANYGLIVYEIEFETSYQADAMLYEEIYAFITEVEGNENDGFNVVNEVKGESYFTNEEFKVKNSNFENGIDGWTLNNISGGAPFAGVHNASTFWSEGYAMNNEGNYFSSYAEGSNEASIGTLTSPLFKVGGTGFITYMLGGAGNQNCFISIEDAEGNVLGIYRNSKFADFPAGEYSPEDKKAMIGNNVFLANFVTYKVDLSAYMGKQVKLVIHDYAERDWGVVFFDELNTFYAKESQIPVSAVEAENIIANKTALNEELALEVTAQGDYTTESYELYVSKLAVAKDLANKVYATTNDQEAINNATTALTDARLALTVRPIVEVDGTNKNVRLNSGNEKTITIADFVNVNELSSITYNVKSNSDKVILSEITNGAFTITAGDVNELVSAVVTLEVLYKGEVKLSVEFNVDVSNELAPSTIKAEVNKPYDVYSVVGNSIVIDFAENVDNVSNLELTYSAKYLGEDVVLNGSEYTFNLTKTYNDKATVEAFTVTISYVANGQAGTITYVYNLLMTDSTAYRIENGGFENGLTGWKVVGNIGNVDTAPNYWVNDPENANGYAFGMDGEKMFSAYAPGSSEGAVGTLTSSSFTVGGSGFVTFKIGAMRDVNYVYIDVIDVETKNILARYYNGLWAERTENVKSGCTLIAYKADLSDFAGKEVFFRISDNADSGYGLFFADSFETYYETEPENFNNAVVAPYTVSGTMYDLFNGGFEMGGVQGWWNNGEPGQVTGADAFFSGVAYGKEGAYLYSGVEDHGAGNGREGNRGVLTSSVFELSGTGYISFMLGGGGNLLCYVQVIDATTNEILARYHQQAMQDAVLIQYVADLSAYIGRTVRIQVVDQAINSWGCVSFDNVKTYYASVDNLPAGLTANDIKGNIKYTIENGSFETGNLDGWTMNITEAGTHNTLGWVLNEEINTGWYTKNDGIKDGNFLFTFVKPDDINCENSKGTLQSSSFTLKQGAFVSFKFGGAGGGINHGVRIELCRANGEVIATFYNDAEGKQNTRMNAYYYQYNDVEVECFFRVVDDATSDYGCIVVDDFRVNLESAPEGYINAIQ